LNRKLSDAQIAEIRAWYVRKCEIGTVKDCAKKYGVSVDLIERICYQASYREAPQENDARKNTSD
jgi:hypothetical protein